MHYCNIRNPAVRVTFREAVNQGISSERGLFMPERIPVMDPGFFKRLPNLTLSEIAFEVASQYVGDEIPPEALRKICDDAFSFPVEIRQVNDKKHVLELFHGPTAAFKDFGARFLAQCFSYFSSSDECHTVVLVATSGDTGGAVADSFLGQEAADVIILYPSGSISRLQEQQITTLGHNITALEVEGTFDDCQSMVKTAFTRFMTHDKIRLTSANSINIARLIPQSFYYYYALGRIGGGKTAVSVPSGNFGNLTAAVMAWKSGLQAGHFIAATNINKVVPEYLRTGIFAPAATVRTIANAMDVGNPGNFERLLHIFDNDHVKFSSAVSGFWCDDEQIRGHIREEHKRSGYVLDPHGAVASLALEKYLAENPEASGIFAATAHPAKFRDTVEPATGIPVEIPDRLQRCLAGTKQSVLIKSGYRFLDDYLRDRYRVSMKEQS